MSTLKEFRRKEKEIEEKERLQPWNVDTIGKEAWSKSIINKVNDKKPLPDEQKPGDDEETYKSAMTFFDENDNLLKVSLVNVIS